MPNPYPNTVTLSMSNTTWTDISNPKPTAEAGKPAFLHFVLPGADRTDPVCGALRCLVDADGKKIAYSKRNWTIFGRMIASPGGLQAMWGIDFHYYTLCDRAGKPFSLKNAPFVVGTGNWNPRTYVIPAGWPSGGAGGGQVALSSFQGSTSSQPLPQNGQGTRLRRHLGKDSSSVF